LNLSKAEEEGDKKLTDKIEKIVFQFLDEFEFCGCWHKAGIRGSAKYRLEREMFETYLMRLKYHRKAGGLMGISGRAVRDHLVLHSLKRLQAVELLKQRILFLIKEQRLMEAGGK